MGSRHWQADWGIYLPIKGVVERMFLTLPSMVRGVDGDLLDKA